jgi:hypothetical protein
MSTSWTLFRDLQITKYWRQLRAFSLRGTPTNSPLSSPSWTLVCVFRFCLSAEGKASGCDRVVILMSWYATSRTSRQNAKLWGSFSIPEASSCRLHCSHVTVRSPSLGRSSSVPQSGQNKREPEHELLPVSHVCVSWCPNQSCCRLTC